VTRLRLRAVAKHYSQPTNVQRANARFLETVCPERCIQQGDNVRYSRNAILALVFAGSCVLWGQSPTIPPVFRDTRALELLAQAVAAITAEPSAQLQDLVAEGTCTQWNGKDESASFTYSQIRNVASRFEIHLAGATTSWTISNGRGVSLDDKGQQHLMHFTNAARGNWYIPAAFLIQGMNDPTVSVVLQSPEQDATSSNEDVIVLTPNAPLDKSLVSEYSKATRHEVHIDRSTHMVTEIDDLAAVSTDVRTGTPHSLHYSDYREEGGWLLPHSVEEYFGQSRAHAFNFSRFVVNSNLSRSVFAISQ
jgi:hypothetical protein